MSRFDRRSFLIAATAALAAPRLWARPAFAAYPFSLGIASGAPLTDGIVLWTRLAPDPLNGGGLPPAAIEVRWEVARVLPHPEACPSQASLCLRADPGTATIRQADCPTKNRSRKSCP